MYMFYPILRSVILLCYKKPKNFQNSLKKHSLYMQPTPGDGL